MRKLPILLRHEMRSLLISPAAYIAAVLALLLMGLFFLMTLFAISNSTQNQQPATLFFSTFWVPALLIVPMLTMKSLAEERRLGTLETLMTTPVNASEVVFSKFLAAYLFYLAVWGIASAYPWIASLIIDQPDITKRLLDPGSLIGGYSFIALTGSLFVAVGIFSSSLTRSQLVAGMLSFSIIFLLVVGVAALRMLRVEMLELGWISNNALQYLQVFQHFEDFSRGIIDTRPFVYYISTTLLVLGLSTLVVESKS